MMPLDWYGGQIKLSTDVTEQEALQMHAEYCDLNNGLEEVAAAHEISVNMMYSAFKRYGLDTTARAKAKTEARKKHAETREPV